MDTLNIVVNVVIKIGKEGFAPKALAKPARAREHANQVRRSAHYHLAPAWAPPSMRMFSPFTMGADSK